MRITTGIERKEAYGGVGAVCGVVKLFVALEIFAGFGRLNFECEVFLGWTEACCTGYVRWIHTILLSAEAIESTEETAVGEEYIQTRDITYLSQSKALTLWGQRWTTTEYYSSELELVRKSHTGLGRSVQGTAVLAKYRCILGRSRSYVYIGETCFRFEYIFSAISHALPSHACVNE